MREIYLAPFEAAVKEAGVGAVDVAPTTRSIAITPARTKACSTVGCEPSGVSTGSCWPTTSAADAAKAVKAGLDLEPWPGINYGLAKLKELLEAGQITQAKSTAG